MVLDHDVVLCETATDPGVASSTVVDTPNPRKRTRESVSTGEPSAKVRHFTLFFLFILTLFLLIPSSSSPNGQKWYVFLLL